MQTAMLDDDASSKQDKVYVELVRRRISSEAIVK
jgi:hypothetical protein